MNEREYIDATNLAKIRCTKTCLHDTLPMSDEDRVDFSTALEALRRWEHRLEKSVKVR